MADAPAGLPTHPRDGAGLRARLFDIVDDPVEPTSIRLRAIGLLLDYGPGREDGRAVVAGVLATLRRPGGLAAAPLEVPDKVKELLSAPRPPLLADVEAAAGGIPRDVLHRQLHEAGFRVIQTWKRDTPHRGRRIVVRVEREKVLPQ